VRLHSRLCDLLGIDFPVVQAPIGTASTSSLAAAVSDAGGLGSVALSWTPPDAVAGVVADVRARTRCPFAVNLVLEWPPEERLEAALAAGAPVISLAWGDPAPWIERIHAAGAQVLTTVGSAEEARRAEAAGADAVVAQGWESGGHVWGCVSTLVLVPAVRDAVTIPIVAAGGIADGRGLAAAMVLGADGGWLGTRFLLAEEAPIHPVYRSLLLQAVETSTTYARDLFHLGWEAASHRVLRNSTVEEWEAAGCPGIGARPGEGDGVAFRADGSPVTRYSSALPLATMTGDIEALSLWAGQGIGLVHDVRPAGEIVRDLVGEAARALASPQG
jgi:nitronate monooxygenase